jgi:MATE family multidrug resistance protein
LAAETDGTNNVEEEEGYFIMDYFMHDFRFHFISDYILFVDLLMGQPDIVVEMAKPYLDIVAFLSFHLLFFQAYKQFADGNQILKVLWATIIGNVINVIVNYFLIYGFDFS